MPGVHHRDECVGVLVQSQMLLRETSAIHLSEGASSQTPSKITLCPRLLGSSSPGVGGRSHGLQGAPTPAVGQGNPMLQSGSWGTRRCLRASPVPAPHRGTCGGGLPAPASLRLTPGDRLLGVFWLLQVTQTLTPHWPWCKSPSSPSTCPNRALWCCPVPALGTAKTCEAAAGAAHCPQGLRVSQGLPRVPAVLGHYLEGAECCGQELEQVRSGDQLLAPARNGFSG